MFALIAVPVVIAVIPASSLLSSEVEHGTAQLAWTLSPSRGAWLRERFLLTAALVLSAAFIVAVISEVLAGAMSPIVNSQASFADYGFHGPVVVARAGAYGAIAMLVGAVAGRKIPALVLSVAACLGLILLLTFARPYGEPLQEVAADNRFGDALTVGGRFVASDGTLLTGQEALALAPAGMTAQEARDWIVDTFPAAAVGLPGDRLPAVELRESVLLLGVASVAVLLTFAVVGRRRPY